MEVKGKKINRKRKLVILYVILVLLIFSYIGLSIYNLVKIYNNNDVIYSNVYLEEFDLAGYSFDRANSRIAFYNDTILDKKVSIKCNGKEYVYTFKELGLAVDDEAIIEEIRDYQDGMSYSQKVMAVNGKHDKKVFKYKFKSDEKAIKEFLNYLKVVVNKTKVDGYFKCSDNVGYVSGVDGFTLDIDKSYEIIDSVVKNGIKENSSIELVGNITKSSANDNYKTIDTKVSSFSTEFNQWITARATNLRTALNYIDGAIVQPGEVFSYYNYAGPYNKRGYVFYYEFVGNGVCQIATTVYNAALLGGLEIVKRYPHKAKSVYVDGGLDATVASYASGWNVDFQFKNTYKYPIYVKAYSVGGTAHVELWSNSKAKEGKTYSTESVNIGRRGYTTYLHTYQDGKWVKKDKIATTWYSED